MQRCNFHSGYTLSCTSVFFMPLDIFVQVLFYQKVTMNTSSQDAERDHLKLYLMFESSLLKSPSSPVPGTMALCWNVCINQNKFNGLIPRYTVSPRSCESDKLSWLFKYFQWFHCGIIWEAKLMETKYECIDTSVANVHLSCILVQLHIFYSFHNKLLGAS